MKKTILMLLFCISGAAINIILNKLIASGGLGLPLYLDTVFTITVTFIGGLFWGSLTGILTNAVGHSLNFWGWEGYLFALCSILTAFLTWLFTKFFPGELSFINNKTNLDNSNYNKSRYMDNIMNKIFVLTLLSLTLCFAMSILGGLISIFIQNIRTQSLNPVDTAAVLNPASQPADYYNVIPLFLREIISRIPINIIDRLISVYAGFGAAYIIGKIINKVKKHAS